MIKETLLFVTKGGEDCDNGFTYILELARNLGAGIVMLMVYESRSWQTYEDLMAVVAFAEAGDHETAKKLMQLRKERIEEAAEKKVQELAEKCRQNSVLFTYQTDTGNPVTSIKYFLKNSHGVEMVLLSPNLLQSNKSVDLKQLIKDITKPVVTISKTAEVSI